MRQDNTHTDSLGECYEGGTIDVVGGLMQEIMTDSDGVEAKNRQMQTKTRLTKKDSEKPCTVEINTSPSVSLRQMENLTSGNMV